jgi:CubicO group peptidase (beta-lactamase class C family)
LKKQVRPHGATFEYRSIETDVLAYCMQRVTGSDLADLVSRELWQPTGGRRERLLHCRCCGLPLADGGFNATLRDYARFGLVIANDGVGNGRKIVPCEWIADTLDCNADIFRRAIHRRAA